MVVRSYAKENNQLVVVPFPGKMTYKMALDFAIYDLECDLAAGQVHEEECRKAVDKLTRLRERFE
jgi:hypothetical protein